ncbi:MAG: hypothetical protein V4480_04850 [Patescibacteria group bacterium]
MAKIHALVNAVASLGGDDDFFQSLLRAAEGNWHRPEGECLEYWEIPLLSPPVQARLPAEALGILPDLDLCLARYLAEMRVHRHAGVTGVTYWKTVGADDPKDWEEGLRFDEQGVPGLYSPLGSGLVSIVPAGGWHSLRPLREGAVLCGVAANYPVLLDSNIEYAQS